MTSAQTRAKPGGSTRMAVPSRYRLWYGRDEPPPAERPLRAGPVSASLVGPDLMHVRLGEIALLDRVYMAVRDRDWGTVAPVVSGLAVRTQGGTTVATFEARHRAGDIDVGWRGTVTAASDGSIAFEMDGEAAGEFDYCRIGFCVLHPAATAAGRPYRADTIEGKVAGRLPDLIAPQSIVNGQEVPLFPACSRLAVDLDGVTVTTEFEGDLFEMEDQRNWTDASFKTYCTPIALGYPFRATLGQRFHQVVRISIAPTGSTRPAAGRRAEVLVRLPEEHGRAGPRLGVGAASALGRPLAAREAQRLRAIGLDHLRTDIRLSAGDWHAILDRAMRDAGAIHAGLELALFVRDETVGQLPELARGLATRPPARVLVFHEPTAGTRATPAGWLPRVREALGESAAGATFATGTDGDFAELNRDHPDLTGANAVTYAVNPQVHAFDEWSLAETLATQATTVATAKAFAAGLAIVVSPVTLRQRFNPAAAPAPASQGEEPLPAAITPAEDPRQPSLFAAGWILGSYAALAQAGAASVTYFEAVGPRGLMDPSGVRRAAARDDGPNGRVYPTYHAIADLAGGAAWLCSSLATDDPDGLGGLIMRRADRVRILLANMRPEPRDVVLSIDGLGDAHARLLDERNVLGAMSAPARYRTTAWQPIPTRGPQVVRMLPYATARIDARLS